MARRPSVKSGFGEIATDLDLWKPSLEYKNLSPKTIRGYIDAGQQLEEFLTARGMPTQVEDIKREHIEACSMCGGAQSVLD